MLELLLVNLHTNATRVRITSVSRWTNTLVGANCVVAFSFVATSIGCEAFIFICRKRIKVPKVQREGREETRGAKSRKLE